MCFAAAIANVELQINLAETGYTVQKIACLFLKLEKRELIYNCTTFLGLARFICNRDTCTKSETKNRRISSPSGSLDADTEEQHEDYNNVKVLSSCLAFVDALIFIVFI